MARKTRYVLLGLLTEGPISGYEMNKLIKIRFRFFWDESYGQIYPELKYMEHEGLITSTVATESRQKRTFSLTEKGYHALVEYLKAPVEKESVRLELLIKMYFSKHIPNHVTVDHLMTFRDSHLKDLALLNQFQTELTSIPDPHGNHQDILKVINFGIKSNQAYITWCDETLKSMEKSK